MLLHEGWSANRQAAKAVALHAGGTPSERRELLDMLGLVGEDGDIAPDDGRWNEVTPIIGGGPEGDNTPHAFARMFTDPPAPRHLVPEGLRELPEQPADDPAARKRDRSRQYSSGGHREREPKPARVREPARCGTRYGAVRHRRLGEKACEECLQAERDYRNQRNMITKGRPVRHRKPVVCGTTQGRKKHIREKTPICQACREASNAYSRELYAKTVAARKAAGLDKFGPPTHDPERCGTLRGVKRHQRAMEQQCGPCREVGNAAKREYWRRSYYKKKAAAQAAAAAALQQAS
jgi:hypothetical protein